MVCIPLVVPSVLHFLCILVCTKSRIFISVPAPSCAVCKMAAWQPVHNPESSGPSIRRFRASSAKQRSFESRCVRKHRARSSFAEASNTRVSNSLWNQNGRAKVPVGHPAVVVLPVGTVIDKSSESFILLFLEILSQLSWIHFGFTVKKIRKFTTIHWRICFRLAVVNLQQNVVSFSTSP